MTADLVPAATDQTALEADPVQYMAVVLHRAKGWLAEAQNIESVRETKAIAVGYESVIREKELAFDAQLSATEIVRRCERRIGELIRKGQRDGTIAKAGDIGAAPPPGGRGIPGALRRAEGLQRVTEAAGVAFSSEVTPLYAMGDAPVERFEQAVGEARDEGNLSRANVVRKVKGAKPKPSERSEWHRKTRHIDSNRVLTTLAQELDAATSGLELMDPDDLDADLVAECVPAIRRSINTINRHLRRVQ